MRIVAMVIIMVRLRVLVKTFLAVEDQEIHAEGIEGGDEKLIDGALVNGSWKLVGWVSGVVRKVQTGYIYHYALAMIVGIFILISYFSTWPLIKDMLSK